MTPEGKVKKAVKESLKEIGAWYHMPVQQGFGTQCLDFRGYTMTGLPFEIETKAEGNKPTPRQTAYALELIGRGVPVYLVSGVEEARAIGARIKTAGASLETWQRQCMTLSKDWENAR
jgi:hypothetical protein